MLVWIVSTCLLVLVCLALRQLLRGRVDPRLTYGLWLLVALRMLIPFSPIHSPVSVDGLVEQTGLEERVAQARYAPVVVSTYGSNEGRRSPDDYIDALEEADWFQQSFRETYDSIAPVQILSAEEVTPQEAGELNGGEGQSYMRLEVLTFPDHFGWLRWLWVGGMAVTAAALLITNLRFYRRLKRCRMPYGEALPLPSSLPVYVAPFLPSPCLFGLLRPAIYLNTAALEADNLHHILLHEHTHHRHRDHLWAALRSLCLVIQWFNPLVWLAAHLSRRDCELACDAAVIRALGEEQRMAYGKTLVDMVARSHTPGQLLHTATTMTSGRRSLQERVTLIAKGHRMTALTLAAVLLISAVAAGCAFASAPAAQEDAPALEFSDQFDSYNSMESGRHFRVSQDELDGQPCYLFRNDAHGVSIRALFREEDKRWQAVLRLDNGQELPFEMPIFPLGYGTVSGEASLSLSDLTGNGQPELIYIYGGRGTGAANDRVQVIDLTTMTSIPLLWDSASPPETVTIRPVEFWEGRPNTLLCQVYTSDGPPIPCLAPMEAGHLSEGALAPEERAVFGHYELFSLQEEGLTLYTAFSASYTALGASIGALTIPFVYNAHSRALFPGGCSLSVTEPVEGFAGDPEAAARIQAAYEAITADSATPWQLEVDHPQDGIYRCGITAANGYNVQYVGRTLPSFHWQPVSLIGIDPVSAVVPDGTPSLTLSRGNIFIRAYDNAEQTGTPLVLVRMDGAEHWLTATPTELHQNDIYTHLLHLARDAVSSAVRDSIRVDGSLTDYEAVAADFARQMAANYRALPSWSDAAALDVQVRSSHVFDAYFGEEENFCAGISLWVKVANPVTAHHWQAGAGLSEQGTGQFADYWNHGLQHLFCRDDNGDWYCAETGTGDVTPYIPMPSHLATPKELAAAFPLTYGDNRDWRIPRTMRELAGEQPEVFYLTLNAMAPAHRMELLYAMGRTVLDTSADGPARQTPLQSLETVLQDGWPQRLGLELFERDGLVMTVSGVREVRTETMLDHGVTPHEYTVFVLEPGAAAYVWEAGLSDPAYAEDGQPHPQYAYLLSPLDQRERITEAPTLRELTPDVQGVIHLEASLYVLRFEYAEP